MGESRAEKAQLIDHVMSDRQNAVKVSRGLDQRVLEEAVLGTEDIRQEQSVAAGSVQHVVEHDVMSAMLLDDRADGGDFVRVKE